MFIGRLIGWCLIVVAGFLASAEAVMALGPGSYTGLDTGDILAILAGSQPGASTSPLDAALARLMDLPAWGVAGVAGLLALVVFRHRPKRYRLRPGR